MQVNGRWCTNTDGKEESGQLRFWGQWEAQSKLEVEFSCESSDPLMPTHLWYPYYCTPDRYDDLQNTDPFVFGENFIYSNCLQYSKSSLRTLPSGTVILFGSAKLLSGEPRFLLDTVLVVSKRLRYDPRNSLRDLSAVVSETFLNVTAKPLAGARNIGELKGCSPGDRTKLTLYVGATPNSDYEGMFSFFPAKPEGDHWYFAKPEICLPRFINPRLNRGIKGVNDPRTRNEMIDLWHRVVEQVLGKGLVLGTYAELPENLS